MKSSLFRHDLQLFAVALSLVFSWCAYLADPLLNPDGILYLRTAEAFFKDGVGAAFNLYQWPAYSIAIGLLHQFLGVSPLLAAHALNAVLVSLLVVGFMSLCREAGADRMTLAFSAAVILAHPELNEDRNLVIRDFGFWAFSLFSLLALMRYARRRRPKDVLLWSLAILPAFALRSEALLLALAGPLALFAAEQGWRRRFLLYLRFNWVILALVLLSAAVLIAHPELVQRLAATPLYEQWSHSLLGMTSEVAQAAERLNREVLTQYSDDFGLLFLLAGLLAMLVAKSLAALGAPSVAVLAYGFWKLRLNLAAHSKWPILCFAGTCLVYLSAFILFHRFLQGRHPMLLAFLMMLPVPFFLRQLHWKARQLDRRGAFAFGLALVLGACLVDGFISFGHSKTHLVEALAWVEVHTGGDEAIQTNSQQIAYHSGRPVDWDEVSAFKNGGSRALESLTHSAAYWLVKIDQDDRALQSALDKKVQRGEFLELSRFANGRGDRMVIYRDAKPLPSAAASSAGSAAASQRRT